MPVDFAKVQEQAPELVNMAKAAQVSLEKRGLSEHVARVVLVMDTSGSMEHLYRSGSVQELGNRALVIGLNFDDNGAIEVVGFDQVARVLGEMDLSNFQAYFRHTDLGYGTSYSLAMQAVRNLVRGNNAMPTYCMFVTDGEPGDPDASERQLRDASREPIFWQFMAVGREKFKFLRKLDDLKGREVDNANFFAIEDPSQLTDDGFYEKMMGEYPDWLKAAKSKGILVS